LNKFTINFIFAVRATATCKTDKLFLNDPRGKG